MNNLDFLFCRHRRIPPGDRFFDRNYILFLSLLLSRQRPKKRLIRPRINIPHRHKRGSLFAQMRRGTFFVRTKRKKTSLSDETLARFIFLGGGVKGRKHSPKETISPSSKQLSHPPCFTRKIKHFYRNRCFVPPCFLCKKISFF